MAAPLSYPPPPEQVRERLERSRSKGLPFKLAWRGALNTLAVTGEAKVEWHTALNETRDEWEAAYLREPPVVPGMATVASAVPLAA